jgi:fermentation-respiration switch protein FrsA (DUF1100 family)
MLAAITRGRSTGRILILVIGVCATGTRIAADGAPVARERYRPTEIELRDSFAHADRLFAESRGKVFKTQINPHWFHDNKRFWYRNDLHEGIREFIVVDAEAGWRGPAFDHTRLAEALATAGKMDCKADHLPFTNIEFTDNDRAVAFSAAGKSWNCDLTSYACTESGTAPASEPKPEGPPRRRPGGGFARPFPDDLPDEPLRSPDGKWAAHVKDYDVYITVNQDKSEFQLSRNGQPDFQFGAFTWSPDSRFLAACRIETAQPKNVYLIESSPPEGGRAKLRTLPYRLPGDKLPTYELWVFDVAAKITVKADVDRVDFGGPPRVRWTKDGRRFTYEKTDRGHQRFRLIEVDATTGKARNIIDEKTDTFIHEEYSTLHYLDDGNEIIYASERDGWNHLYLIDGKEGRVKNQITKGPWAVCVLERVDEKNRQLWFAANGMTEGQNPYLLHHYRINIDGTGLVALTPGDGIHTVQWSPDRKYLIDTYSRVDQAPIHELRRADDGGLICTLERAQVAAQCETGWRCPEVFHAKGRDGETDIWGMVCRPRHLDETKTYPVIEYIYAGPHGSFVPTTFRSYHQMESLADLGFIVVQIDGMGTANRSKKFHDVCWKNLSDAGFPDRILWIKALAQKYSYVDTTRVGIYGTSAGGQNAAGAVLFHPEFYKVAVASCGCHDNRMDKAIWNERWMGYPVDDSYAENSNITHADRLKGKLMLIVGELDTNVPPESTMRLANALIKAGKDFDLLVIPGMGHSDGGAYGERRRRDFFVRHLLGVEPPDRNAGP